MQRLRDIQVWLKPISGSGRLEQSQSVRLLLQQACDASGVRLPDNFLSLPGLELIKQIKQNEGISVSLAHCPGMATVAMGLGSLGVDCERAGKNRRWGDIAQHFFTSEESNTITSTPHPHKESQFLRHWVVKESYIKANYGSLFGDINRLMLTSSGGIEFSDSQRNTTGDWWVWHVCHEDYHFGISSKQPTRPQVRFFQTSSTLTATPRCITSDTVSTLLPHSERGSL